MNDYRFIQLLARKISGEATPDELSELSENMEKRPDAVYYTALFEEIWESNDRINELEIDEIYRRHRDRFADELADDQRKLPKVYKMKKNWLAVMVAASILIIFSVYLFLDPVATTPVNTIQIVAGKGIRKKLTLPDGTLVWLNSGSKLDYDAGIKDQQFRVVRLSGEAFFDVKHIENSSFLIHTNKISVRVLGTAFNVKDYPDDQISETTLLKGSIELSVNNRPQQKIILKPSEKFALVTSAVPRHKQQKDLPGKVTLIIENISPVMIADKKYIEETSWKEDKLVFENESLEELIPKFERWFNVTIHAENQKVNQYRFTGIFLNENIEQALTALKLTKSFNYKLTKNEVKIY
jgi:transmembrane sensor